MYDLLKLTEFSETLLLIVLGSVEHASIISLHCTNWYVKQAGVCHCVNLTVLWIMLSSEF